MYKLGIIFVKFIAKHFILFDIIIKIVLLMFGLLIVNIRNTTDFFVLDWFPASTLNLLVSSNSLLEDSLGISINKRASFANWYTLPPATQSEGHLFFLAYLH